jgi:hypothetical protein
VTATPAGFTDADNDTLSYSYVWKKNGVVISGQTGSTLDLSQPGFGDKGDTISVEVKASDGTDSSAAATDSVVVKNSPPVVGTVSLSPSSASEPKTNQTLTATPAGFTDDDAADTLTYNYVWKKNGVVIAGETGNTLNLGTAGNGDKGDTITVEVKASDGTAESAAASDSTTVKNSLPVAGAVAITPDSSTEPKTNDTITATVSAFSDADSDSLSYTYVWKNGSTTVKTTAAASSLTDTLDLSVAGNGNKGDVVMVSVTASDGEATSGSATDSVTVKNTAPELASPGDKTIAEGSTLAFSLSAADADNDPLSYTMSGGKSTPDDAMSLTSGGAFSWTPGDNYGFNVTFTASDGTGSDAKTVSISSTNVNPTASSPSLVFNSATGEVTAGLSYQDVGWHDTHSARFDWTIDGVSSSDTVPGTGADSSSTPPKEAGTASKTRKLSPGCHTVAVSAVVRDDDGGESSSLTIATATTIDVYTIGFAPPIMDNERNIARYGNIVPVKVRVTSGCTGTAITSLSLFLSYVEGTGDSITGTEQIAETVSAADGTGGQMRTADSMYIYNFTTKPLTANKDYTLRVKVGSQSGPVILTAVLQPKK